MMASKERQADLRATVDDLIQCPICLDVFENPRSLPCLHTFCYGCLDALPKDKTPGKDSVECPVCRRVWNIPPEGVAEFAHNFFLQRMVDSSKSDAAQKGAGFCELCADKNKTAAATRYCIDCRLRQCEDCHKLHNRVSGGNHRIRESGAELERELLLLASSYCIEHTNKMLELYCSNCSCNVCVKCVGNHPGHELHEIEAVASDFKSQMRADVNAVKIRLDETVQQDLRQKSALMDFCDKITIVGDAVEKQCESIKSYFEAIIDNEKQRILQELQLKKEQTLKNYAEIAEFTSLSLISMKSFIRYSEELGSKGQPCDVTRAGNDMHKRASTILEDYPVTEVYIGPSVAFEAENLHNVFASVIGNSVVGRLVINDTEGRIVIKDVAVETLMQNIPQPPANAPANEVQSDDAILTSTAETETQVIAACENGKGDIGGLTSCGNELFVVRHRPGGLIEVYDATNFAFKRKMKVKDLDSGSKVYGLTSCCTNKCLYLSEGYFPVGHIHRVELTGNNKVVKWKVNDGEPQGLSINSRHNLMVACYCYGLRPPHKLIEYTTRGKLSREIFLRDDAMVPWHAVQLNNGQFVVSHSCADNLRHGISIVDANGRVLISYMGNKSCSEVGQLSSPKHLAVTQSGSVLVADMANNRIVVLDGTLKWLRNQRIDVGGSRSVCRPYSLCLDEKRSSLFVGEWNGDNSRVVIVNL